MDDLLDEQYYGVVMALTDCAYPVIQHDSTPTRSAYYATS